jgi:hypothetical protein
LHGGLYGFTIACFGSSCLFPRLNYRRIFIRSLIVFFGLSGRSELFLSLEVCLTGFLIVCVQSPLGDYFQRCLDMVEELFRTSLIEYGNRQVHLVGDLNFVDHLWVFMAVGMM